MANIIWGAGKVMAYEPPKIPLAPPTIQDPPMPMQQTTSVMRKAAADRIAAVRNAADRNESLQKATQAAPGPGSVPDYFGTYPNYANSPLPTVDNYTNPTVVTGGMRKFVDALPGIPIANPDTITYPGSDYYEISLQQFTAQMHSDLPATKLRGYVQTNNGTDGSNHNTIAPAPIQYLGPTIAAQRDRPVRVKFTNNLPIGTGGNLFIPVDTSVMGAGPAPNGTENYTQNRATIHLHGGDTPWISDGTPHQWTTPAAENTTYPTGVSVYNVPDMPDPGPGSMTFFYTNEQSARLMFYHDHALGITRLNVYAGEAAPYLVTDSIEQSLITAGTIPSTQYPLVIQDKTFVPDPAQLAAEDPTWDTAKWGGKGNLWYPHVYMPNQNPFDLTGTNAMGRWDYGPWFWPPYMGMTHGPVDNPYYVPGGTEPPQIPGVPNVSETPEAFMDTPVVNGKAYPTLTVAPTQVRFRILNACNDRSLNLQLYYADNTTVAADGRTFTEVKMVTAAPNAGLPATWPTDGRDGGVPDPTRMGPSWIQIGTEGGFLPAPAVIPPCPIGYEYFRRSITVLNVSNHSLLLGPAERADVIVDFSGCPVGSKLILYNDSPAPIPGFDPRLDYYTGDPDQRSTGGAPPTVAGWGPNTRTMMQITVSGTVHTNPNLLANLQTAFASTSTSKGVFAATQPDIIVPQARYNTADNATYPADAFVRIQDSNFTYIPKGSATPTTINMEPKAIQELFDVDYGRMNSTLGVEIPNTNAQTQTTIPYGYIEPPTENITDNQTQIWKITHNGVDTHFIHFHLFNVQLINRVGWDGAVKPPDDNELGWKETVRMNPLEDAIVALQPVAPKVKFGVPTSTRLLNPTKLQGDTMGFSNVNPDGTPTVPPVTNEPTYFGWEYVWHCHILGHEEFDMMRPIIFNVTSTLPAPSVLSGTRIDGGNSNLTWIDPTPKLDLATLGNPANEVGYRINRAVLADNGTPGAYTQIDTALANATSYTDTAVSAGLSYSYYITAWNAAGTTNSNTFDLAGTGTPTVVTENATPIGNTWAVVKGTLTDGGGQTCQSRFRLGTSSGIYTDNTTWTGSLTSGQAFSENITGLTPGVIYYYVAECKNSIGTGRGSEKSFTTSKTLTVTSPNGGEGWVPGSSHNITWTSSGVPGNINIQLSRNSGTTYTTIIANTPNDGTQAWTVTAPVTTTARIKVISTSNPALSDASDADFAITTAPAAPILVAPTSGFTTPNLTPVLDWNDSAGAVSYGVQVSTVSNFAIMVVNQGGLVTSTYTIPGATLAWNTSYYWRANATNTWGITSAWSAPRIFKTALGPPPVAPSNLTATPVSSTRIDLAWQDNSNNETGFKIERKTGAGAFVQIALVGANVTTYSNIAGLVANTNYVYRVRAYLGTLNSLYSNEANATTAPVAPTLITPANGVLLTTLTPTLNWNAPAGAASYAVQVSTVSNFTSTVVNQSGLGTATYPVPGGPLALNTLYYWRANASNVAGATSAWSVVHSFRTPLH
jgi:FtsP/CotA-like multicopper oxidase with cupredoxin domain